ncbi:MAG: hypothetical protein JST00_02195 [Deltaproteobacteria bacterium]|nr:hypothetical protein [Deltaproteobacteria bacterium]
MLFPAPAVVSCVVTVLALLVGAATIAVSSGPGLRALRWFGAAAICASVYAVCTMFCTLDVGEDTRTITGRIGGMSASFLVASWFVYFAASHGRDLGRAERIAVLSMVAIGVAWLVPGVCRTSDVFVRDVPWLGVAYATTRPTAIGRLTYAFLAIATTVLAVRLHRSWRRGKRGALGDFLGVSVQLVAGINDALAASGHLATPYMLDIGQFAVVLAVGSTLIARFVSDARALERSSSELRAAQTELVRRERLAALGELSAVVAHEVRNPVTVIFSAVSSLRKRPDSAEASTLLDILDEEAERLKRVVGELLDFARPRDLSVDEVKPGELVEGAVEAALAGFDGKETVAIEKDRELPPLTGDEQLLRQALINLITNALQAAGRSQPVRIRIHGEEHAGPCVAFDVSDDGAGIPKEVAEKMFTPFFTTRASGTGLGLAIVKRIAEAHGGDVTWRAGDERGVTFTLRVPRRGAPPLPR